jgi:hypothetical protein
MILHFSSRNGFIVTVSSSFFTAAVEVMMKTLGSRARGYEKKRRRRIALSSELQTESLQWNLYIV